MNATNGAGTGSQTFILTVSPPTPSVTNPNPMTALSGAAFSYLISATNTPTSYSVIAVGLTLSVDGSGLVTGTLPIVTSPVVYSITLNATNSAGTGSQTFPLTVNPLPSVVTNPGAMTAVSGTAFSYLIVATNSPTSYNVTAAGLALSVSASGLVTGTLPVVTTPTDYSITLSATNVSGTGSQTFILTVIPLPPVAGPTTLTVPLNTPTTLDLAPFIAGSVTDISIVVAAKHGTTGVSGKQVTYTPDLDYFGADAFSYVATGSGGSSAAAVVTVKIVGRPDPAKNVNVIGLLTGQLKTAKHFAQAQISNFQLRMENLHRAAMAKYAASNHAGAAPSESFQPTLIAYQPGVAHYRNDPFRLKEVNDGRLSDYPAATGSPGLANFMASALTTSSANLAALTDSGKPPHASGNIDVWGAGNVRWGTRNPSVGSAIDFRTDGASLGADKRVDEALTLGLGMGYARDKSTVGTDGTGSSSKGLSVATYGSYLLSPTFFMDGLIGYQSLSFNTDRYVASVGEFARAKRKGNQLFGSLALGYEYRADGVMLSPYGRYDFVSSRLQEATETGAGLNALRYASQTWHNNQMSAGMRTELEYKTDFGWLLPRARIEYQRNAEQGQQASIAYADLYNGLNYNVIPAPVNSNALVLGVGSDLVLRSGLKLGLDYQTLRSSGQEKSRGVNFRVSKELD